MKKDYIELVKELGEFKGMDLWEAIAHYGGATTKGYALVGTDTADFYSDHPADLSEDDLLGGLRLPSITKATSTAEEVAALFGEVGPEAAGEIWFS